MDTPQHVVAAVVSAGGELLVRATRLELPGGRIFDDGREEALVRLVREQIGVDAVIGSLLHITAVHPYWTCYLYLARAADDSVPTSAQTLPLTSDALAAAELEPAPMAELLRADLQAGRDLFSLPDLRDRLAKPEPGRFTEFNAWAETESGAGAVEAALTDWLPVSMLRLRPRVFGSDVVYEDDTLYLYVEEAPNGQGPPPFNLQGELRQGPATARDRLADLARCCRRHGVRLSGEYVEVDEAGDEIGPEQALPQDVP